MNFLERDGVSKEYVFSSLSLSLSLFLFHPQEIEYPFLDGFNGV